MNHLYELITEGVVDLNQIYTHKLRQMSLESKDIRVTSLIGSVMNKRSYINDKGVRLIRETPDRGNLNKVA